MNCVATSLEPGLTLPCPGAGLHQLVQRVGQGRRERGQRRGHGRQPDPEEGGRAREDDQVGGPEGDQAQGREGDGEEEEKMLQRLKYFVLLCLFCFYNISYSRWRQESFIISFCPKLLLGDGMHLWTFHE